MKWTASKARPKSLKFSFPGFPKEQLESINHSIVELLVLLKEKEEQNGRYSISNRTNPAIGPQPEVYS
jgi:hypothetical protein